MHCVFQVRYKYLTRHHTKNQIKPSLPNHTKDRLPNINANAPIPPGSRISTLQVPKEEVILKERVFSQRLPDESKALIYP
jgi:hypothetical protein